MTDAAANAQAHTLRVAGAALQLSLTDEQIESSIRFLALLQRWNTTYNLTSVREPGRMLGQHVIDSLAAIAPLKRQLAGAVRGKVLDIGSGAGLPGVVIALVCPEVDVLCVDAVGKKAAFIRQAAAELRLLNLRAEHARIETLAPQSSDVITARAFASLHDFTELTLPHLATDGVWMAMKGKTPHDELAALPARVEVFHVEQLTVPGLNAERCLVWMRRRTASGMPTGTPESAMQAGR